MAADGSGKTNITPEEPRAECPEKAPGYSHAHHSREPTWSPDGSKIAFEGYFDICKFDSGGASEIWVMNPDGSGKVNLTGDCCFPDAQPSWSPDGTQIAFVGTNARDRADGIFTIPAGGGTPVRVTTGQDIKPNWGRAPVAPPCPLFGGSGKDTLNGTNKGDKMCGLDGDDVIQGLLGDDVIDGGAGNDKIDGGGGNDTLIGGLGNDKLIGSLGNDKLQGGDGSDTLDGGPGKNTYDGGAGNDVVNSANNKPETVKCGAGKDKATADARDKLIGCEKAKRVKRAR
jgi:hypothetical protein